MIRKVNPLRDLFNQTATGSGSSSSSPSFYSLLAIGDNTDLLGSNGDYLTIPGGVSTGNTEYVYKKVNGVWTDITWQTTIQLIPDTDGVSGVDFIPIKSAESGKRHIVLSVVATSTHDWQNHIGIGYGSTITEAIGISYAGSQFGEGLILILDDLATNSSVYDYPFHNGAWNEVHALPAMGVTNKDLSAGWLRENAELDDVGNMSIVVRGITI